MGFFDKKKITEIRTDFTSRADAFAYMLSHLVEDKNTEPMEAAEKADKFADIFAKNLGLPEKIEIPKQGVDKYLSIAEKIGDYFDAHPKIIDIGIPIVTGLFGLFLGKKEQKVEDHDTEKQQEPIDFDKL
ncbi:MAG: hypothetical protein RR513_09385 [Muribaculaceae bacterium]